MARALLQDVIAHGLEVRLLTDGTKVGFEHQLLMVALAYRRRALPIAWTWAQGSRGHSSAVKQKALLAYIHGLLPAGAQVSIAGDSEFGAVAVLKQLEVWKWSFVMRQKGHTRVKLPDQRPWWRFDSLAQKGARRRWLPDAKLARKHGHPVHLVAWWKGGEPELWLLATNLPTVRDALRVYKRRMWIEEISGNFKKHGFDLESSHLRYSLRLSRLTLVVALLYTWLVAFGPQVIKHGQRHLVDRADRKDLSVFRIGMGMFERRIANDKPFILPLVPYFS